MSADACILCFIKKDGKQLLYAKKFWRIFDF